MSALGVVRAALQGRLAEACRVCLAAEARTALSSEVRLRTGVFTLREVLARVTHSEVERDGAMPAGLCDACLRTCLRAFHLLASFRRSTACLQRCLHQLAQHVHTDAASALQENRPLLLTVPPLFSDYELLREEQPEEDMETELKRFECTMCAASFTTELLLRRHERSHPPGTAHICRQCGRLYKQRVILNRHIGAKHGDARTHLCVVCGKTYASTVGLRYHQATQHAAKRKPEPLPKVFTIKTEPEDTPTVLVRKELEDELVAVPRERNVMCDICAKTFNRRIDLKKHMKNKHAELECPECGKAFKVRSYYERHVQKHFKTREELKVHRCEYCPYATDKKFLLTCHTRRRHTHVRPYVCELCGKGFYLRREVTLHMSVHTKARPESCTICSKRFVNKTALLFHSRLHTGERPYACPACPERFLNSSRRGAHVRSKHRPRPQCRLCGATFTDKQVLKKHIQNVHGKEGRSPSPSPAASPSPFPARPQPDDVT